MSWSFQYDIMHALGYTEDEYYEVKRYLGFQLSEEEWWSIVIADEVENFEHEGFEEHELSTGRVLYIPYDLLYKKDLYEID